MLWLQAYINTTYIPTVSSESKNDCSVLCIMGCMWQGKHVYLKTMPAVKLNIMLLYFCQFVSHCMDIWYCCSCIILSDTVSVCFAFIRLHVALVHVGNLYFNLWRRQLFNILELKAFSWIAFYSWNQHGFKTVQNFVKVFDFLTFTLTVWFAVRIHQSLLSLSVSAAMQRATTVTPAPPWCTAAAHSTAYTPMESSGAYR